jgi:hypothetical protein
MGILKKLFIKYTSNDFKVLCYFFNHAFSELIPKELMK